MPRSLFRKEAIDAQREKFLGEASVAQPVRMWVYTATACFIALIVIAVAVWGQYQRRERVQGYLASAVGAADVRMPDTGTIAEIMVKEGDVITAGTPMSRLTIDRSGTTDATGNAAVEEQLRNQVALLRQERTKTEVLGRTQAEQVLNRVGSLQAEVGAVDSEIRLQAQRVEQARALLDKWVALKAQDYASEYYILQYQKELKDQEIKLQTVQRQRASLLKDLGIAQSDLPAIRSKTGQDLVQIDQRIDSAGGAITKQQLEIARTFKRDMVVVAPIDGTVTNIGPTQGQTVESGTKLATVLPKSPLHAELLVPTRAIGFVKAGQAVTIRYEAFPYERFGQYGGKVDSVSRTPWMPGESSGPLAIKEPLYRIVVALDQQDVAAGDQRLPLRAGMLVSADLLMERRTLLEWLFQPVLQLRQRMDATPSAHS